MYYKNFSMQKTVYIIFNLPPTSRVIDNNLLLFLKYRQL